MSADCAVAQSADVDMTWTGFNSIMVSMSRVGFTPLIQRCMCLHSQPRWPCRLSASEMFIIHTGASWNSVSRCGLASSPSSALSKDFLVLACLLGHSTPVISDHSGSVTETRGEMAPSWRGGEKAKIGSNNAVASEASSSRGRNTPPLQGSMHCCVRTR